MKRLLIFPVALLCNLGLIYSQTYFDVCWSENGYNHMNFRVYGATINGYDIEVGDEIGIFDGNLCVGAGVFDGTYYLGMKASEDDPTSEEIDGFVAGHSYSLRLWDASENIEVTNVSISLHSGSTVFVSSGSAWMYLAGTVDCSEELTPSAPSVSVSQPGCGGTTGSIEITAPTGTGMTYSIDGSTYSSSMTFTNIAIGTYSVRAKSAFGCISDATIATISARPKPEAPAVNVDNNCESTVLSTTAAGTLLWSTGESTPSITVTNAGTYTVTTTVNGCTSEAGSGTAAPGTKPATPVVTVTNDCGSSVLSTTASGTLRWNTGASSSSITVTHAGTYTVTTTVSGCTSEEGSGTAAPETIPAAPAVTVVNNCDGTSVLSTTAAGTLEWSTGASTPSITVTHAGTYTVTRTVDGCTSEEGSGTAAPNTIPATPVVTVANDCGSSVLSTTASGTLQWNTGASSSSITVTHAGTYTVTTTVSGCTSEEGSGTAAPETIPAAPAVTVVNNCDGTSVLSTTAAGTLEWSTGASTPSITVTHAGTYTVTRTVDGCTSEEGSGTAAPNTIPATPVVTVANDCGSSVLSTTAAGTLEWSTGASTQSITVTHAGNYSVTTTVDGCTSEAGSGTAAPKTIPEIPVLGAITHPSCNTSTGSIVLSGLPAGNWTINPGDITGSTSSTTINTLIKGTYNFTVTNASGCTSQATSGAVINAQPSTPSTPSVGTVTQPSCSAAGSVALSGLPSSGSWTLTRSPGGTTYSGTGTSHSVTGLPAGTFTFSVTNASECTSGSSSSVTVIASPDSPITPAVGTIVQTSCSIETGSVVLSSLPSSGSWTITRYPGGKTYTGSGTSTTISELAAATTYRFAVTNAAGCTSAESNNVVLNAKPSIPIPPTIGKTTNPSCTVATGSVELTGLPVSGTWTLTRTPGGTTTPGTGPFSIISGLTPGMYTYTVTNSSGCTSTASLDVVIDVQSETPATPLIETITQPTCSSPEGSVVLTGLPLIGSWTLEAAPGGSTTSGTGASITLTGLATGSYAYTVTNASGCTSTASLDVVINSQPEIPPTPVLTLNGNVLHSDAISGNQWYTLSGSIDGATLQDYTVTADGDYYAVVTNSICSSKHSDTLHVTITALDQDEFIKAVRIYPNPVKHELTIEVENGKTISDFEITNSLGQIVHAGQLMQHTIVNTAEFSEGVYLIKLVNEKNCYYGKIVKK